MCLSLMALRISRFDALDAKKLEDFRNFMRLTLTDLRISGFHVLDAKELEDFNISCA